MEILILAQGLDNREHSMLPYIEKFHSIIDTVKHSSAFRSSHLVQPYIGLAGKEFQPWKSSHAEAAEFIIEEAEAKSGAIAAAAEKMPDCLRTSRRDQRALPKRDMLFLFFCSSSCRVI